MGWSIGGPDERGRFVGYGVPAYCDHPDCDEEIDRGLGFVCGGEQFGGEYGCGLYFCEKHLHYHTPRGSEDGVQLCARCVRRRSPYKKIASEHPEWVRHVLTDESWSRWRAENPREVAAFAALLPTAPAREGA